MLLVGCDFNPLGGNKSRLDPTFEPGKHTPSAPPTIGPVADFTIDENDVQTINFHLFDPDSFMMCSYIFVRTSTSNSTIIDSSGLTVGGVYPNCTLKIAPKAYQFGVVTVTLTAYDYWNLVPTNFQLNVVHIMSPGAFTIIDAIGGDKSVEVTWQNAAYMMSTGAFTSPFYTLFYRPVGGTNWSSLPRVTSPHTVTGLTNGVEYEFYVLATNSMGTKASNTVRAFASKYQFRAAEFVPMSNQYEVTSGTNTVPQTINSSMVMNAEIPDAHYPVLAYSAAETPVNGNFAIGTPKPSSVTSPDGKYKVYVNSQADILSGAEK
ncbi:MAG: fibronectin type III domain-containing protein [Pseudobdellovibrio sp.]